MLYLLGGASRAGKGIVADRFLRELAIPYFSIDYLVSGLAKGFPVSQISHELPNIQRAEKVWPVLKPMLINILQAEKNYLVDGDAMLPRDLRELLDEYPASVKACFVGYVDAEPKQKLDEVRTFIGNTNNWTEGCTDAYLLQHIQAMKDFSRYVQDECKEYNLQYFDVSCNFPETLKSVFDYLTRS